MFNESNTGLVHRPGRKVEVGLVFLSDISCQMKAGLMHKECILLGLKPQWSTKAFNVTSVLFIL